MTDFQTRVATDGSGYRWTIHISGHGLNETATVVRLGDTLRFDPRTRRYDHRVTEYEVHFESPWGDRGNPGWQALRDRDEARRKVIGSVHPWCYDSKAEAFAAVEDLAAALVAERRATV